MPALSVRGENLRQSLRSITVAWMYGIVWLSCISGSHVKVFARMLGFNDFAFGLLAAIPFIATFGQLFATIVIERTGLKKYLFIEFGTIHRLLWLAIAALPLLLPLPSPVAVIMTLVILVTSWFMASLSMPAWFAWMGDLIPRRIRGRYLANRTRLSQAVQIVAVITIGIVLDVVTLAGEPETAAAQPMLLRTICFLFAIAAISGTIDILMFRKVPEVLPKGDGRPRAPVLKIDIRPPANRTLPGMVAFRCRCAGSAIYQLLLEPLKDRVFRNYVGFGAAMTFTITVGAWYFWLQALENLGFSNLAANVVFLVVAPLAGLASAKPWGKLIDAWGRRPALILATAGSILSPIPWFFATVHTPAPEFLVTAANWLSRSVGSIAGYGDWTLVGPETPVGAYLLCIIGCTIGGACWTGINIAQVTIMLGFADGQGRSKYLAASSVLISFGGIMGGLVGGLVTQSLAFLRANPLGPFMWNNCHAAFVLTILSRMLAIFWLARMPDPGSRKVRDLVRHLRFNAYNAVATRLFYPVRVFGWRRAARNAGKDNSHHGKGTTTP